MIVEKPEWVNIGVSMPPPGVRVFLTDGEQVTKGKIIFCDGYPVWQLDQRIVVVAWKTLMYGAMSIHSDN